MGKQLEAVEMDKAMLEQSYAALHSDMKSLKQTVRDKNKRNAAPIEYLEKAHQQLEMCKKKEEEGKKRLEDLQTELDFKSVQVTTFEEDFQLERKSRAEAVGKLDDMRREYETKIEEMKEDLSATRAKLDDMRREYETKSEKMKKENTGLRAKLNNTEDLLVLKQQQFYDYLDNQNKEHSNYKEKMESDLAAKAALVKEQTMAFKEQIEMLANEKEEAVKDRDLELAAKTTQVEVLTKQRDHSNNELEQLKKQLRENQNPWIVPRGAVQLKRSEELGHGGWGYVVKGTFRRKTVAVKCIYSAIASEKNLDRVCREIETMALVRHPNLVLFIAAVLDNPERPLIVTELLDTDLCSAYEKKCLTDKNKLSILLDVALALNYLHTLPEPIIHRDVSSKNVLLERATWKAKLSDFGSARLAALAVTKGEGCYLYAAPEMFSLSLQSATKLPPQTTKADSFSFGILLCELMMEEEPDGDIPKKSQQIEAFSRKWPCFHTTVTRCVRDDPAERPSMDDIIHHPRL